MHNARRLGRNNIAAVRHRSKVADTPPPFYKRPAPVVAPLPQIGQPFRILAQVGRDKFFNNIQDDTSIAGSKK